MIVTCPLPDGLITVPVTDCPTVFDQIVRLIFARIDAETHPTPETLKALATWTPRKTAVDNDQIVVSPLFAGFVIPSSEALTTGGNDNSTINGMPRYNGEGNVTPSGNFENIPGELKKSLSGLTNFSIPGGMSLTKLGVYLINRYGAIIGKEVVTGGGTPTTTVEPIPIFNFRLGSTGSEGLNASNLIPFGFSLLPNWDETAKMYQPDFDPLTQL